MGVLLRIIFSHTPDEAKSGGLAKACVPGKNYSVPEKIESLNRHKEVLESQMNMLCRLCSEITGGHSIIQNGGGGCSNILSSGHPKNNQNYSNVGGMTVTTTATSNTPEC